MKNITEMNNVFMRYLTVPYIVLYIMYNAKLIHVFSSKTKKGESLVNNWPVEDSVDTA